MQKELTLAITGDSIINRRISVHTDESFLALIKAIRDADVGYTQVETVIHDYEGPEIYPAAVGPTTHERSPHFVAEELKWAGFDIVSTAGNHSLDYSYGGLYSTCKALDEAGLPHAGTGMNLGDARAPAYLDTPKGRVALISMCSSFSGWARAGQTRPDVKGRPGINPLRHYYAVDAKTLESIKQIAMKLGLYLWLNQDGKTWLVHNTGVTREITRFVESDQPGVTAVVDEDDAEGNLRSISEARRQADWVLVHLHDHEFDPEKGHNSAPAKYVTAFARACIDAGADVFIAQGSHAPRGIELYKNKPIFYDPRDFISQGRTVTRLPADNYLYLGYRGAVLPYNATPADAYDFRAAMPEVVFPTGGAFSGVLGSLLAVCSFGGDRKLTGLKLYPVMLVKAPRSQVGLPMLADADMARKVIEYLAELSSPFGTKVEFKDGLGLVKP